MVRVIVHLDVLKRDTDSSEKFKHADHIVIIGHIMAAIVPYSLDDAFLDQQRPRSLNHRPGEPGGVSYRNFAFPFLSRINGSMRAHADVPAHTHDKVAPVIR